MLLLYFKILIISQRLSKFATSSYRLQGHEGRSVRFTTCVKDEILNASCKLHTPAFMTLELQSFAENVLNSKSKHYLFSFEFVKSVFLESGKITRKHKRLEFAAYVTEFTHNALQLLLLEVRRFFLLL